MSKEAKELRIKQITELRNQHPYDIGVIREIFDKGVEFANSQKPTPSEGLSAKEYLDKKGIHPSEPIYWDLAMISITLEDLLIDFSKQDNHTRIEPTKKANAELMEEVVKKNQIITRLIYSLKDACTGMEWLIREKIPSIGKTDIDKLEEWRSSLVFSQQSGTPEAYQKQDEWISVEEKPEPRKPVYGSDGKVTRIVYYLPKHFEIYEGDDDDYSDYCDYIEEKDVAYWKEGWYSSEEQFQGDYDEYWIVRKIIHWQPLPTTPTSRINK